MLPSAPAGAIGMSRPAHSAPQPQPAAGPALHQYACLRCRSRRVKCDKILSGCANCASHSAQCVYSARRPRKSQKQSAQEPAIPRPLLPAAQFPSLSPADVDSITHDAESDHGSKGSEQSDYEDDALIPREFRDVAFEIKDSCQGRLVADAHGRSRYVNSDKVKQVAYLETVLSAHSIGGDKNLPPDPCSNRKQFDASTLLSPSQSERNLRSYHPAPDVMHALWDYYCRHVDMMVKILYKPSVEALVLRAMQEPGVLDPSEAPLLFAIWFAATTSMSSQECRQLHHGEDRAMLMRKYRHALEQALAQSGWMMTQNIQVLQALSLFLVFASENARSTWIVNGMALSLAQAMGLHSDSASSALSVIDTEVRRRVWWMLCQTDVRASENCGLESHVPLKCDTEPPLHVNDADLASAGENTPAPRNELTEMTLSLVKIEMSKTNLRFKRSTATGVEKERIVRDQLKRYEDVYLKYFDGQSEFHRLCYLGGRLIIARLWKMMYDATPHEGSDAEAESLMLYNADVLEIAHQLPSKYRQYGWFFRCKYTQWHAVAFLLIQLCKHTHGPAVDRSWQVLEAVFADWEGIATAGGEVGENALKSLWQPLLRLLNRARQTRDHTHHPPTHPSPLADTPSTLNTGSTLSTGYDASHMTPEDLHQPLQLQDGFALQEGLIGDPFFGTAEDFSTEMNWEQLDEWVQNFQDGLYQKEMDCQDKDMTGALNWW